eukprot:TRINITY_DN627_c3_g1_i2.p2 TRINITY_DN627_c3_g1~~TRINITY_DN627_c3_g1_i2.p2  ORF type:complete len:128 (+),score=43.83 TRINITY_DN627_c3_g1_i2:179-562(+)
MLPAKFRRVMWIKRGDLLVCSLGGQSDGGKGAKCSIRLRLTDPQIRSLRARGLFPDALLAEAGEEKGGRQQRRDGDGGGSSSDADSDDDVWGGGNPNAAPRFDECDDEEEEEEEEEEDEGPPAEGAQ